MSIFNELLPKIKEISNAFTKNFNDDLMVAFENLDKFEEEYQNGRGKSREKSQKDKNHMTTLQSIHEDEDEPVKNEEVISSPEQQRQKRNASVKAQSIISKQVNVNLTQKLRRENSTEKSDKLNGPEKSDKPSATRSRRRKEDDKENDKPAPLIQIKQEKISLQPEPMDLEPLPADIEVKQEMNKDEIAMPPPTAPVPKPRKALPKEKSKEEDSGEVEKSRRRTTKSRKQVDAMPLPVLRGSSRASSRALANTTATALSESGDNGPEEPRPKRTRAKRKASESTIPDTDKEAKTQENGIASPAKPRPKRTRRGRKASDKEIQKPEEVSELTQDNRISDSVSKSPILTHKEKKHNITKEILKIDMPKAVPISEEVDSIKENGIMFDETHVIEVQKTILNDMDRTVVLPNGVYNHAPVTPKNIRNMNETVVLDKVERETMVLDKQQVVMDATVVIERIPDLKAPNITDDNSIMTDDNDSVEVHTPPKQDIPAHQPTSAVKEKVQQFEELASRVTRTKTRAMAKKEEQPENQTPPDKISKPILSVETLQKMNSMIFNGKPPQISSSATKPRAIVVPSGKSAIPSSTSKLSAISKAKEAAEESLKKEKEDARKKKEAMLEAKRELQKKKREEKMAAAAAAREAAERDRRLALQAAARDRLEKQAHADLGKIERMKEAERKKQELARKVAETEERRRAEEIARQQRLAEEQRRAEMARRKQAEEAEAMKKEAVIMAKEIEKRQKEYIEKQKLKHRSDDKSHTPLGHRAGGTPGRVMEPVYMADGFQYLNSDEDEDPPELPVPDWSTSKARKQHLLVQCHIAQSHIDRLFSVRVHSPDLRDIFPDIERTRLKRTSSAVWRTPPSRLPALHE